MIRAQQPLNERVVRLDRERFVRPDDRPRYAKQYDELYSQARRERLSLSEFLHRRLDRGDRRTDDGQR